MSVKLQAQAWHRANSPHRRAPELRKPSASFDALGALAPAGFPFPSGVCALGSTEAPWPLALFSPSPTWRRSAALRRDPGEPSEGSDERSPHEAELGPHSQAAAAQPCRYPPPLARDTVPRAPRACRGLAQGPSRGLE